MKSQRLLKRVGEEKPRGQWADPSASAPISHKRVRRLPSWTESAAIFVGELAFIVSQPRRGSRFASAATGVILL